MTAQNTINHYKHSAKSVAEWQKVEGIIAASDIDPGLHHLVLLRASQINKCGFCVEMHSRDARKVGESSQRLDHLIVWEHVTDFTEPEKAAFAWTEALTELHKDVEMAPLRKNLQTHFSDAQISTLTSMICMINLWNRLQISNH
ncbi:MAG: carboxymuconolactone decarboxylase family protein [Parvibaculaceae bacterium]|nr:carboxymuconolactone decarboxylase family protein [Parvibaculaceae bacterium]